MSFGFAHTSLSHRTSDVDLARIRASLAQTSLFSSLPMGAIDDLARRVSLREVRAHRTIVSQDEPGNSMFVLLKGRVKAVIFGQNGREVTLALLRPGDVFGEVSVFDGQARSANCIATEGVTLLALHRDDLLAHIAAHPRTSLNLLEQMAKRIRRADTTIAQLALCDVNERLIWQLVSLAREEGVESPDGLLVRRRPTQQELANMIGSCRETISRAFNQLARDGLIIPRGRAMVVTPALLENN